MIYTRSTTNRVHVGCVNIGHHNNVVIQAMTSCKTSDVKTTLQQIKSLHTCNNGVCQLVRVSVLDNKDALALKQIVKKSPCPIIADIHYRSDLAKQAILAGVAKIRINPCNFTFANLKEIILLAKKHHTAIRIGFNEGSYLKKGKLTKFSPNIIIQLIKKYVNFFEKHNFYDIIISCKSSNIDNTITLCKLVSKNFAYPQHIGLTESGFGTEAIIRTTLALSALLKNEIGDTIRVSINSNDINDQVKIASALLNECSISTKFVKFICCPQCGRHQMDVKKIVNEIEETKFPQLNKLCQVAIMGCAVNGIGECQKADIGVYGLNKQFVALYYRGRMIKQINQNEIINYLVKYIKEFNN